MTLPTYMQSAPEPTATPILYPCTDRACKAHGKLHPADQMGIKSNGQLSTRCKYHFDLQTAAEANRPQRTRSSAEYNREYRKKQAELGDEFKEKERERLKLYMREKRAKAKLAATPQYETQTIHVQTNSLQDQTP
jgi:hypothetical protein